MTAVTSTSSDTTCPQALFLCSTENLPSIVLLWFFDDDPVAEYQFPLVGSPDEYPHTLQSASPNLAGVVMFEIVRAVLSESNSDNANFVSTLSANLSALRGAGVAAISCGSIGTRSNVYALDFDINEFFSARQCK